MGSKRNLFENYYFDCGIWPNIGSFGQVCVSLKR